MQTEKTRDTCDESEFVGYTCKQCWQSEQTQARKMCEMWTMWTTSVVLAALLLPAGCAVANVEEAGGRVYVLPLQQGYHGKLGDALGAEERRQRRSVSTGSLGGTPGQGYYLRMGVGTPQQMFNVLIDTGSSNFALAAAAHMDVAHYFNFSQSSTFENIGTEVYVPYTKGDWHGYLGRDEVTIVSLPNVTISVDFALIDQASEFYINGSDWQGILGMGYAQIARPDDSVVPFFDALIEQKEMKAVFSMQLCGMVDGDSMAGTLVLGGEEKSLYTGEIRYAQLYKEWYYEVVITDIQVAGRSVNMPCKEFNFDKTIVDSGTTNLRLPNKVFDAVTTKIAEHTNLVVSEAPRGFWTGEDILCWSRGAVPWDSFPLVSVTVAESENSTFELQVSPRQYLRPVPDSGEGASAGAETCYKYAIVPSQSGSVIGAVVMEGFYVVFDKENRRIGFAENTCPGKDGGTFFSKISDYKTVDYNTSLCAYYKLDTDRSSLLVVAYVLAAICGLCLLLLLLLMVIQWQVSRCRRQYHYPSEATPTTQLIDTDSPLRSSSSSH